MRREGKVKKIRKLRRAKRIRRQILSSQKLPRLTVFASNQYTYAQIIDDNKGETLVHASEKELSSQTMTRIQKAAEVGKNLASKAIKKKIKNVVFDKGAYKYHGRVKALADGAREGGLVF